MDSKHRNLDYQAIAVFWKFDQNAQSSQFLRNNYDNREINITCTDANSDCTGKFLADKFYQNPRAENKSDYLKKLGANNIIERKDYENDSKLLGKGLWDGVVDTVGGSILANAISQTKHSGIVAACGNAANIKLNTTVMPFIIRGVKLWGIDSVTISKQRREFVWSQVSSLVDFKLLEKNIKVVNLEELLNIFPEMLNSKTSGRILVDLNK